MQKLNLGCGVKKLDGFLNIDKDSSVEPDKVLDLESGKLPYKENSVDHVVLNYVLEYIGDGFLKLLKEIYRVCESGATIEIRSVHPRHESFLDDIDCKRPITLGILRQFSKKYCSWYQDFMGKSNGIANLVDIDFEILSHDIQADDDYLDMVRNSKFQELAEISKRFNNVIRSTEVKMVVIK
jgi:ubiquinone/menaquinone biosynthesis C-methylase UbiE